MGEKDLELVKRGGAARLNRGELSKRRKKWRGKKNINEGAKKEGKPTPPEKGRYLTNLLDTTKRGDRQLLEG